MKLEVRNSGSALAYDDKVWRVKDLLPSDALTLGALRLSGGQLRDDGVELHFAHGERQIVPLPSAEAPGGKLLIKNIGQLLTLPPEVAAPSGPSDEAAVGLRRDMQVLCHSGRIVEVAPNVVDIAVDEETEVIDAAGRLVTPGLVDPHTHPVFAGERSQEFGLKAAGASYLEIHKAGGGIFSTVAATRAASFDELRGRCCDNLTALLRFGVTTVEGKSGYALSADGELRLLEVLRCADGCHPVDVVPTLLGAHAIPKESKDRRDDYIGSIIDEMIPRAAGEGLARFCDAYCEEGAFSADEVERIFVAAGDHGLGLRLHAEQFTHQGGAELAGRLEAATADHLEAISDEGIAALAAANTTAVVLPGAAMTCRAPWPPTGALLEAGVRLALGTDLNPGSSMTANLPLMMSLACMQMGVSCEQAWRAVTVEPARSLGLGDRVGSVLPGYQADLVLFDVQDYRTIPYYYGVNHASRVIKRGRVVLG